MSTFFANYPTSGASGGVNPSVGVNGTPAPGSSTEVGFVDGSGNLQAVSPTTPLPVTIESEVGTLNVNVSEYGGAATTLGQKVSASSIPVVIASDQSTIAISAATLPLPTGASTSALQTAGNATLVTINTTLGSPFQAGGSIGNTSFIATQATGTNLHTVVDNFPATQPISGTVAVSNFPATQPVSGTVTANQGTSPWVSNITQFGSSNVVTGTGASGAGIPRVTVSNDSNILASQSGTWNITNISGTISLPTGASTSANQTTLGSQTTKINDGTNTAAVKAASTAALATDPALVVAISPNNSISTTTAVNTNGSASNSTTVTNTAATTFSAPANAVGFVVEAESSNTVNLRYACGTTATTTVGMLLEPGRDSGFIPSKGTVTVICTTAATNQAAGIQWVLSS